MRRRLLSTVLGAMIAACACGTEQRPSTQILLGDVGRGRLAVEKYGCGGCHTIPGVRGARGIVGPSLAALADRPLLAGSMLNTPANLIDWVRDPGKIEPLTFMPNLSVTEPDARDIASFLYRRE
jgi:cytochrome c